MDLRQRIGSWRVDFREGWLEPRTWFGGERLHPDGRLLQVLKVLVENAGQTVSVESILRDAWCDRVVSRDSVTTAIYQLRQLLNDDTESPRYIVSEPRRGYRLIAKVAPLPPHRAWRVAAGATATLAAVAAFGWALSPQAPPAAAYIYVSPMQNYEESPVQEPLFSAIETTFLSELIQTVPGRVRTDDGDDIALRLESMMVACDLGPTLVMRILDTRSNSYVWSNTYNLDEVAASTERPTLVELAASDVSNAIL